MNVREMIRRREKSMRQGRVDKDWMSAEKKEEVANEIKEAFGDESKRQEEEDLIHSLPTCEAEDIGCHCQMNNGISDEDFASEWEWDAKKDCYVCSGCGDVQ